MLQLIIENVVTCFFGTQCIYTLPYCCVAGNNGMSSRLLFTTATTFSNCFSLAAPVETETADVAGRMLSTNLSDWSQWTSTEQWTRSGDKSSLPGIHRLVLNRIDKGRPTEIGEWPRMYPRVCILLRDQIFLIAYTYQQLYAVCTPKINICWFLQLSISCICFCINMFMAKIWLMMIRMMTMTMMMKSFRVLSIYKPLDSSMRTWLSDPVNSPGFREFLLMPHRCMIRVVIFFLHIWAWFG